MMLDVLIKTLVIILVCGIGILGAVLMALDMADYDNAVKKREEHDRLKKMYAAQREFEEKIKNLDKKGRQ